MAKEKYISLKEAAAMSGYTADYVGQLIRRGKLPGKQVFSNVAWMTTEEAIQEYMELNNKSSAQAAPLGLKDKIAEAIDLETIYKVILGATIGLVAAFMLFLGYILSVSIEKHIDKTYEQKLESL